MAPIRCYPHLRAQRPTRHSSSRSPRPTSRAAITAWGAPDRHERPARRGPAGGDAGPGAGAGVGPDLRAGRHRGVAGAQHVRLPVADTMRYASLRTVSDPHPFGGAVSRRGQARTDSDAARAAVRARASGVGARTDEESDDRGRATPVAVLG